MAARSVAPPPDPFRVPPPPGVAPGVGLSVLAHAGLLALLAWGVAWKVSEPMGVTAELWAAVPEVAAARGAAPEPAPPAPAPAPPPPAPTPPPAPREADIATEAPPPKPPPPAPKPAPEPPPPKPTPPKPRDPQPPAKTPRELARERQAEEARLAALRQANLERLMREAGGTAPAPTGGTAARDAGPSAGYAGRIKARIRPNIVLTDPVPGNPLAEVEVRAAPDGTIVGRRLVRPSGDAAWDDAVLRAIDRTETLPRDVDGRVPGTLIISFRPND